MAMDFSISIEISGKPGEVFSWINDQDKAMRWQKGVKRAEIIKGTPQRIGTTFKEEIEENGKSLILSGEITDYIPDKLISFHLESKIHHVYVAYSVVGAENLSMVKVDSKIKWKFPMNIICLFTGQKIKANLLRQTKSELTELKTLCETK